MSLPDLGQARVLVAGGSRGIGLAIAAAFARHGARLGLCARGHEGLQRARETLQANGAHIHVHACDLADAAQIEAWVEAAATALGGIDIVVNNASGFGNGNDDASWQAGFDVDLMAAVRTNRFALPHLRRSAAPVILNISSINGRVPTPRAAAYSTAKAALDYYTVTLATELARERIRVNAIAPGSIEFPGGLWDQRRASDPALYERIRERIPFGGFGDADDVAAAAVFLCSPAARWITGQVLAVDGGQSLPA
ncbi:MULTISPECIES: SDR family NAD(P)-dependent oxidoreductase [Stenotrophomonas]|uniref:3-oxoacyl-ACP reductase n=2 Tax=Stenotrophomonas nitritireducens TaxID=83617 RepID=A0ABR5NJ38_9GAMM|nr:MULTISPECIES: SDR family oxidoreductase [Stenotrophomonas]KQO00265.1 3-oxoacyl-ACP reductase [Stenotrophomonas sp. Leaf70]KRG56837.1 3-oxoacyl-ACP reductase [Stenotrophomonas nitritireducens]